MYKHFSNNQVRQPELSLDESKIINNKSIINYLLFTRHVQFSKIWTIIQKSFHVFISKCVPVAGQTQSSNTGSEEILIDYLMFD